MQKRMSINLSETDIKQQIKDYLAVKGIFSFPLTQGIASYRGAPDRIMHYHGAVCYLEAKRPGGKLSAEQLAFREQCEVDGIQYLVISNLDELIEFLC